MKRLIEFTFISLVIGFSDGLPLQRADIVIADFEGKDYGGWTVTGEAFGPGPAQGTLPGQMAVSGFMGHGLVNSFFIGDGTTGTVTSPPFTISRRYINFLIGGGKQPGVTCLNLLIDGKTMRTATGPNDRPGGSERLDWKTWDVSNLDGKDARIEIVDRATGGWGHINVDQIVQSDVKQEDEISTAELYNETYRPQFHFTARKGWLNDPNGLVYYAGEYHLFFQHNPFGTEWGNMTWGHAISKDLAHWRELDHALKPDALGTMFSGSAVVDWNNTTGFASGKEKPLVAIYTAAGDTSPESKGKRFSQCIAYSNDRGGSWTKYDKNPVLRHIVGGNRDPKVVWHAPTKRWIMALFLDGDEFGFFSSTDLKSWKQIQTMKVPGCGECPDFFEMPVEPDSKIENRKSKMTKWVWTAANGKYLVGTFDGEKFTPEQPLQIVDHGANYYAVQTYSDIPATDGRRIQIAWMSGGSYPKMPFNQQMSFPCALTLRDTAEGLRLFRWPVREIDKLVDKRFAFRDIKVVPGANPLPKLEGELWDIEAEFEIGEAKELGIKVRGESVTYSVADKKLRCLGREAVLEPSNNRIRLRVLVDRTSMEVFENQGRVSMTSCFLPRPQDRGVKVFAHGGACTLKSIKMNRLRSAYAH